MPESGTATLREITRIFLPRETGGQNDRMQYITNGCTMGGFYHGSIESIIALFSEILLLAQSLV